MFRSFSPVRRKFSSSPVKTRYYNNPPLPEQKSQALPPPAEFRDPPKDQKLDTAVRESNFAKVRQKKLTETKLEKANLKKNHHEPHAQYASMKLATSCAYWVVGMVVAQDAMG